MKILILLFLLFFSVLFGQDRALLVKELQKEKRVALIIGNNNYSSPYLTRLKNPINDARAMKRVLVDRGFDIIYRENAGQKSMRNALKSFSKKLKKGGIGLFYYAGHGIQLRGENYLLATDSQINSKDDVEFESMELNRVLSYMRNAKNRLNIVILDACRNDPFSRSASGGLAPVNDTFGMFVAYATQSGGVAKDGEGENGVFTKNLVKYIKEPLPIEKVFKKTREAVYYETDREQKPGVYNQIIGDFYFTIPSLEESHSVAKRVNKSIEKKELRKRYYEPEMVLVNSGTFMMGDENSRSDERPSHKVTIEKDFYMSKYEITKREFDIFVASTNYKTSAERLGFCYVYSSGWERVYDRHWKSVGFEQEEYHPVTCVSWNDAKAYANWLSEKTNRNYKLPSESQWEYVARQEGFDDYFSRTDYHAQKTWYKSNSKGFTHNVGEKRPNALGLYDMYGNVWEWCEDWYYYNYSKKPKNQDPNTKKVFNQKTLRGGAYDSTSNQLKSTYRQKFNPDFASNNFGFRLVLEE